MSSINFPGALWRKSSYSNGQANCVEVTRIGHGSGLVAVRDSKTSAGPAVTFAPSAWRRFTATLKAARVAP